jgi:DNA-binding transcriptional MerR regulator
MTIELDKPTYRQAQVARATGVDSGLVQNWANRGLIRLALQDQGTGHARLYTAGDALRVALIGRLTEVGVRADTAATIVSEVSGDIRGTSERDFVSQITPAFLRGVDACTEQHHWLILSRGPQGYWWTLGQSFHNIPQAETGRPEIHHSTLETELLKHKGRAAIVVHLEDLFGGVLDALTGPAS